MILSAKDWPDGAVSARGVNAHQGVSPIQNDHAYNTLMLQRSIVYLLTQICTLRMPVGSDLRLLYPRKRTFFSTGNYVC